MRQLSQIYLLLLLLTALSGCTTLGYYSQAVYGHLSLMMAGEPVNEVLASHKISPELREKLLVSRQARLFSATKLALPAGDAFTDYVELDQPWVVYIDSDTAFNESFATAVELEGLKLWLIQQGNPDAFQRTLERLQHRNQTLALVQQASTELAQLYQQQDTGVSLVLWDKTHPR